MLKVIKSSSMLTLVLLLNIPAHAAENSGITAVIPMATNSVTNKGTRTAIGKSLSAAYNMLPSWQKIKQTSGGLLSSVGSGFSRLTHGVTQRSKAMLAYATPAVKATLAFGTRHSTFCKIIGATLAAAGAGYSAWKVYAKYKQKKQDIKSLPAPTKPLPTIPARALPVTETANNKVLAKALATEAAQVVSQQQVVVPAPNVVTPAPAPAVVQVAAPQTPAPVVVSTPVVVSADVAQLQAAKIAAEEDIAHLIAAREAGEASANLDNNPTADEAIVDNASGQYIEMTNFTSKLANSSMPKQQESIRTRFGTTFRTIWKTIAKKTNCLNNKAEFDALIGQLRGISQEIDDAIAQ